MSVIETSDYEDILQIVSHWPETQRFSLVHDVLKSLEPPRNSQAKPVRNTLQQALGLADNGQPAPSDAEVEHWLEEHRLEKYG